MLGKFENKELTPEQEAGKQRVIAACRASGASEKEYGEDWDAYAYPQRDGIAWGVNGPPFNFCVARGIVPK